MSLRNIDPWVAIPATAVACLLVTAAACSDRSQSANSLSPPRQVAVPPPGKGNDAGGGGGRHDGGKPGGGEEGYGNNLANPVVFAEGLGLTGLPVTDSTTGDPIYADTGLRPTATEGLTVTSVPFSYLIDNPEYYTLIDGVPYYEQKTPNAWQPEWQDAAHDGQVAHATVDWADNIVRQTWTTNSVVRVEIVLDDLLDTDVVSPDLPTPLNPQMTGFNMTYLQGTGKNELWGTDGSTGQFNATIYSVCPRLQISKCQGEYSQATATCDGSWLTAVNLWTYDGFSSDGPGAYSAEVNVSGKVIYGYNWMLRQMPSVIDGVPIDKDGWWRISFSIDNGGGAVACNAELDNLYPTDLHAYYAGVEPTEGETDPVLYEPRLVSPTTTELDVLIVANRGHGGGKP